MKPKKLLESTFSPRKIKIELGYEIYLEPSPFWERSNSCFFWNIYVVIFSRKKTKAIEYSAMGCMLLESLIIKIIKVLNRNIYILVYWVIKLHFFSVPIYSLQSYFMQHPFILMVELLRFLFLQNFLLYFSYKDMDWESKKEISF